MRLFVAVELPPPAVAAAVAVSDSLRERVAHTAPAATLTWIPAGRMHLTIRFIGEVDAATAGRLIASLAHPFETSAFDLFLGPAGVFPERGGPRVLWLGIAHGRDGVAAVEHEVSDRLAREGIPRESRPFSPHLTLARVREAAGLRGPALTDGLAAPAGAGGCVDAITLFESRLSPRGPTYTALQRTPLRRA